jgi:DNA polymerase III subunit delta
MPSARDALKSLAAGVIAPVYLVVGEERFLRDELTAALRNGCLADAIAEFNEDRLTAGEDDIRKVISAAQTLPLMATRRFVLVKQVERWEGNSEDESRALDELSKYAEAPSASTCLVLCATKLDGRRKLVVAAKKRGFYVDCAPLSDRELGVWVTQRAASVGNPIEADVAELLAAIAGPDLGSLSDCIERLSLHQAPGQAIDEQAISVCVARVRVADTWALVDAISSGKFGAALARLRDAYDPRDRGLPMVGAIAWSMRQLARYHALRSTGARHEDAAKRAGAFHPDRARDLERRAKDLRVRDLERWFLVLAETDLALKGSKRPPESVLEDMVIRLCKRTG